MVRERNRISVPKTSREWWKWVDLEFCYRSSDSWFSHKVLLMIWVKWGARKIGLRKECFHFLFYPTLPPREMPGFG